MSAKPRMELSAVPRAGQWVRWLVYRYGYTRVAMAHELGVSTSMVSAYSAPLSSDHHRRPSNDTRALICELAKITEVQYFRGPPIKVKP